MGPGDVLAFWPTAVAGNARAWFAGRVAEGSIDIAPALDGPVDAPFLSDEFAFAEAVFSPPAGLPPIGSPPGGAGAKPGFGSMSRLAVGWLVGRDLYRRREFCNSVVQPRPVGCRGGDCRGRTGG